MLTVSQGFLRRGYLARCQTVLSTRPPSSPPDDTLDQEEDAHTLETDLIEEEADPSTVAIPVQQPSTCLINLTHHIVYSPTYHVPQILFAAHALPSNAPLSLPELLASVLLRPPPATILVGEGSALQLPSELDQGAEFPLLSLAEHPVTGEVMWAAHPCHSAEAVDEVLRSETDPEAERDEALAWLETWLMIVGTLIDLRWRTVD